MSNIPNLVSLDCFIEQATRFLFFTGKGGVGKTSLACATAVALADQGKKVLLVSTDPASNLDEVLGLKLNGAPTSIPEVEGLLALNIDPEAAAQAYRDRLVGPYRGKLPEAVIRSMEEQLSGACTTEIAAFDEFARLLGEPFATADFDHVIFDTAPTGHTLRLMTLPTAWTGFLDTNTTGNSCLGPLAGLQKQREIYENAVAALADGQRTTLVLVSRPQKAALDEAERTSGELSALGVRNQRLIINGVFRACCPEDKAGIALERRDTNARQAKGDFLKRLPLVEVPLRAHNLVSIMALRELVRNGEAERVEASDLGHDLPPLESLIDLVDDLARSGRGVIMTMGKSGVGKTTVAAAMATELARRGLPVHLSTTDPDFTRVLLVTLPEATSVHEAAALQADLKRAQIEPFAWVINQSFARADRRDPMLLARGVGERPFIHEVTRDLARRTVIVPWVPEEPVGPAKLQQLFQRSTKN